MSGVDISDRKVNQRWFAVFQEIVTAGEISVLGPTAFCVYCVIKSRAHRETGRARIFLADIARLIGRKDDAVIRALKVLKQHGYVDFESSPRKGNLYQVMEVLPVRAGGSNEVAGFLKYPGRPDGMQEMRDAINAFVATGVLPPGVIFKHRRIVIEESIEVIRSEV
jgi:hypothetical protein